MNIKQVFENFAVDFERAIDDDNWKRLEKYLANDATYINIGIQQEKLKGAEAILEFLQQDVKTDRKFSSRTLIALTEPQVQGNRLTRKWRTIYTLTGTPDLLVEGEARYLFEGDLIKAIEQELTPESSRIYEQWMREHGDKLHT